MATIHYPTNKTNAEKKVHDVMSSELEATVNASRKRASMNNLILWNITKALEKNPHLDLKFGLKAAQERLERDARLGNAAMSQCPEEQHLICALLAWQQIGRTDADSLYQFIETKRNEQLRNTKSNTMNSKHRPKSFIVASNLLNQRNNDSNLPKKVDSVRSGAYSKGPVVKLPVNPKIVMRMDNTSNQCPRRACQEPNTSSKINAACCMDSECAKNLAAMDADTEELRRRATQLAKREAERVELLERAESAWGDLELGYQRRLRLAEEKEEDMAAQIAKIIEERNEHKKKCSVLAEKLKGIGDAAEAERAKLRTVEKTVCDRACMRLRLSEEAAKGERILAEQQCKAVQLERDLQFKEEQARRKLLTMDNETESARVLMHEAERALRAELSGLREQIGEVSALLLQVDELNKIINAELDELRKEKADIIEDLDGCKVMCETKIQKQVEELHMKRKQLEELKEKVLECQCKVPVDVAVEVKRTPSLAALCKCTSEDKFSNACSCTSLRSRLISSLLADLFGGLQSELGGVGLQMPCQMLKCLEDKHNWDRSSVIKNNLRNFFSKLLVGELDIAIATSIENYHAKWTGTSCADEMKMTPSPDEDLSHGWEQRALERRAQKLAEKLAEQLFQDRADELTERAKQIVKSGPPPCECNKAQHGKEQAVMQCFVDSCSPFSHLSDKKPSSETPAKWSRTRQDVTQLRLQIEDLKKEFIKKEDLKLMEEHITKILKHATAPDYENVVMKDNQNIQLKNNKREMKNVKNTIVDEPLRPTTLNKGCILKKRPIDVNNNCKKYSINERPTKQPKKYNYNQSYAVNVCMCGPPRPNKNLQNAQLNIDGKHSTKQKPSKEIISQDASFKPVVMNCPPQDTDDIIIKVPIESTCGSNCKCFEKMPSNTSIDKLLETLSKWKYDLADPRMKSRSFLTKNSKSILKSKLKDVSKLGLSSINQKVQERDTYVHDGNIGILTEIPINFDGAGRKNQVLNFNLAANTASEYMGTINLDKSNECVSTCVDTTESNNVGQQTTIQESSRNVLNDCNIQNINLADCHDAHFHEEMQPSESKDYNKVKVLNEHLYGKIQNTTDLNVLTNSKSTTTVIPQDNEHKSKMKEIFNQTDLIKNESNNPQMFPNNFDYYIKFLGVTLADADSQNITKNSIKEPGCDKNKTFSPSSYKYRERYLDNHKEDQRNPRPKLINDLKKQLTEDNNIDSLVKMQKCECNTKFEEFQRFMINIFSDQSKKRITMQKDIALDSPSLKCTGNHLENCACCTAYNVDNSKDLEVNAFYLLEDHLKEKLKEFKICSCKSSCISPQEEEKIFSAILKRVKQVISDCANEVKCNEPGLTTDASWRRAYGLLQEYLKIKIKRVQCSPILNENKDIVVPNILEKVCNLIETDFQRLKDLCKCNKNNETFTKNALLEHLLLPSEDIPEKDTNICNKNDDRLKNMLSKQNSVKHIAFIENISSQVSPDFAMDGMDITSFDATVETNCLVTTMSRQISTDSIVVTQTISSQVPPNLGLETKSCDALEMDNKSEQTSKTNLASLTRKSQGFIYNTCDCFHGPGKQSGGNVKKQTLKKKDVVISHCADVLSNNKSINPYGKQLDVKRYSTYGLDKDVKSLPNFEVVEYNKNYVNVINKQDKYLTEVPITHPYIGYTIDCTCNGNLKDCICPKSVIKKYTHKVNYAYNYNQNAVQDFSYIMQGSKKGNNNDTVGYMGSNDSWPNLPQQRLNNEVICETEPNDKELVLLLSTQTIDTSHQTTNTSPEIVTLATDIDSEDSNSLDWYNRPHTMKPEIKSSLVKYTNFQYDYEPTDESMKSCKSELTTDTDTTKISHNCNCYKVPICHVKMLVDDIEKSIMESKCTCDSVSKICPVHSRIFH